MEANLWSDEQKSNQAIEENVIYKNAFLELEADIVEKKYILVEDNLAKTIIQKILIAEGLEGLLQVELCPGGASNIKKYTLLTYSKTGIDNRYITFDGDQKKKMYQILLVFQKLIKQSIY